MPEISTILKAADHASPYVISGIGVWIALRARGDSNRSATAAVDAAEAAVVSAEADRNADHRAREPQFTLYPEKVREGDGFVVTLDGPSPLELVHFRVFDTQVNSDSEPQVEYDGVVTHADTIGEFAINDRVTFKAPKQAGAYRLSLFCANHRGESWTVYKHFTVMSKSNARVVGHG